MADFNGDGYPDALIMDESQRAFISYGGPAGHQPLHPFRTLGAYDMACGDINGDGFADAAFTNRTSTEETYIAYGSPWGHLVCEYIPDANPLDFNLPTAIAIGDFNADGFDDTAFTRFVTNDIQVNYGSPGGPTAGVILAAGAMPWELVAGDVDNAGDDDLVCANISSNNLRRCK